MFRQNRRCKLGLVWPQKLTPKKIPLNRWAKLCQSWLWYYLFTNRFWQFYPQFKMAKFIQKICILCRGIISQYRQLLHLMKLNLMFIRSVITGSMEPLVSVTSYTLLVDLFGKDVNLIELVTLRLKVMLTVG